MKLTGIMIAAPAYGHGICIETTESLIQLTSTLTHNKVPFQFSWLSAADLPEVRNTFLTVWYDGTDHSHLLFIDTDMQFNPLLVRDMLGHDKPVTGVIYAKRQFEGEALQQGRYEVDAVGKTHADDTVDDIKDGFLKVLGTGAGVFLIRRDAIDAMIEKMPDIVQTNEKALAGHPGWPSIDNYGGKRLIRAFDKMPDDDGAMLSEDMSFCKRIRDCGMDVWANVTHPVTHIGRFGFTIRYADFLASRAKAA